MAEKQYKLPDVGEGLTEADIIRWQVAPGDAVAINQTIVEIETAKAAVELPCPYEGTVRGLLVEEGQTVDVGTPIITVDVAAEDHSGEAAGAGTGARADEPEAAPAARPTEPADEEHQPVLVGYGVRNRAAERRPRKRTPTSAPARGQAGGRPPRPGDGVTVLAKPPVRKLAKDLGIDLSALEGTGPHGTISRADVEAASEAARSAAATGPAAAPAPEGAREERVSIRGVRKRTAEAMVASAFTAPHVTEFLQVDATATVEAAERIAGLPEFAEVRVSPLLLAAKALLVAVRRHPMVNSTWDGDAGEIVVKHYINLGVAVASQRGLVVPNIKDAHAMTLPQLADAMRDLVETARAGKTAPGDMQGGTITVNNVGVFGVDGGTPILNPGEAAILALGQIRDLPWVVDGRVVPRKVTTLALSFDHRIVDGELGSKVLRDVGRMLEDPTAILAWS